MKSLENLRKLAFNNCLIPEEIVHLQHASLEEIFFERVKFTQASLNGTAILFECCQRLRSVNIHFLNYSCHGSKSRDLDSAELFSAILKSKSLRVFKFCAPVLNFSRREFDSFIELIRETGSLQYLNLQRLLLTRSDEARLIFDALAENKSLVSCVINYVGLMPECSEIEREQTKLDMNMSAHRFLQRNNTLMNLEFGLLNTLINWLDSERLIPEYNRNRVLDVFHINPVGEFRTKLFESKDTMADSLSVLCDQATDLVQAGRTFAGARTVFGKGFPLELIESILECITEKSHWNDDKWKQIRRVLLDRRSIGKLYQERVTFDAYELLYRCRSID